MVAGPPRWLLGATDVQAEYLRDMGVRTVHACPHPGFSVPGRGHQSGLQQSGMRDLPPLSSRTSGNGAVGVLAESATMTARTAQEPWIPRCLHGPGWHWMWPSCLDILTMTTFSHNGPQSTTLWRHLFTHQSFGLDLSCSQRTTSWVSRCDEAPEMMAL